MAPCKMNSMYVKFRTPNGYVRSSSSTKTLRENMIDTIGSLMAVTKTTNTGSSHEAYGTTTKTPLEITLALSDENVAPYIEYYTVNTEDDNDAN